MKRMFSVLVVASLFTGGRSLAADLHDASLATYRDYTIGIERDRPIQCKPGDVERFPGQTMGQVFGVAWPTQPALVAASENRPAEAVEPGRMVSPRGLESQSGLVTVATLVDTSGRALQVEAICMTSGGFATAAKRAAKMAGYLPALINGEPVISVAMQVFVFRPARAKSPRSSEP